MARGTALGPASAADYVSLEEATTLAAAFFDTSNLRVTDVRVGAFAAEKLGYLGEHKLLSIEVRREARTDECTFFLKALWPNCNDFDRRIFAEEGAFFGEALPRLLADFRGEGWAPKCYLVKDQLLVLEDLRARGFRTPVCRDKLLTDDQLRTATATLARFHACSMMALREGPHSADVLAGRFREKMFSRDDEFVWKWLSAGIEVAEGVARHLGLDPACIPVAYDAMLEHARAAASTDARGSVLRHEDLWCNNLMFSADDKSCRLVDFQMVSRGSFAIDVLQLLHVNADRAARRRLWHELVRLYHEVLRETLEASNVEPGRILCLREVSRALEDKRIFGLVAAVQMKPIILLNAQLAKEFSQDPVLFERYTYTSRADFVSRAMQSDDNYRRALEESVGELVDFMEHFSTSKIDDNM